MTKHLSADLETGRGSWDEGRKKLGGRGSCRAENGGDWRLATGETAIFLEFSASALPKNFLPENRTPHFAHRT